MIVLTVAYTEGETKISVIGDLGEQPFNTLRQIVAGIEDQIKVAEFEAYYQQRVQNEDNPTE